MISSLLGIGIWIVDFAFFLSGWIQGKFVVWQIPKVMDYAFNNQPREIRMEAAYFFQQLCQSRLDLSALLFLALISLGVWINLVWVRTFCSSLTLQMFIACRGIPVLVGFLEADYARYRFVDLSPSAEKRPKLISVYMKYVEYKS